MKRLGYAQFVAQGGDWGAVVTDLIGAEAPPELLGIHTNMPGVVPVEILKAALFGGEPPPAGLPADERQAWEQLVAFGKHLGYAILMGTRPQTLAGFADSPVGFSRTNADDRLPLASPGRVEGGDGIVEGSHVADVCPQPTIPDPPDDLTQLGAIGYDDEVDSQAVSGPRLGRAGDGHQRSSGANHARRPLPDVAAEDIENQIDPADIF